jgi:hypothetical protein
MVAILPSIDLNQIAGQLVRDLPNLPGPITVNQTFTWRFPARLPSKAQAMFSVNLLKGSKAH